MMAMTTNNSISVKPRGFSHVRNLVINPPKRRLE